MFSVTSTELMNESMTFLLFAGDGRRDSTLEIVEFCITDGDTLKEFRSQFEVLKNELTNTNRK